MPERLNKQLKEEITLKNDPELQKEIENALQSNSAIDVQRIKVETRGGKVILKGSASSYAENMDAQWVARSVPGVSELQNDITVTIDL